MRPRRVPRVRAGSLALILLALLLLPAGLLRADAPAPLPAAEELAGVRAALERGAFSEAIAVLELWSDRGVAHPDVSFDRGLAYLGRAESTARRDGDLGQAVAAFEEALYLDPSDDEPALLLERIRASLVEQRAKRGAEGVVARPRLLRALLGLIGEQVWAGLAALGALALGVGLAARLWARAHPARLSGAIAAVMGLVIAGLGAGMAAAGQHLRLGSSPAVVIVQEARLLDSQGRPLRSKRAASTLGEASDRAPEGTLVHISGDISGARAGLVRVEWGDGEAWLNAREVRRLAAPR